MKRAVFIGQLSFFFLLLIFILLFFLFFFSSLFSFLGQVLCYGCCPIKVLRGKRDSKGDHFDSSLIVM